MKPQYKIIKCLGLGRDSSRKSYLALVANDEKNM